MHIPAIFISIAGSSPVTFSKGKRGSSVIKHFSTWIDKVVGLRI